MTNYFKYEKIIQCKDTGEICKGYTEYLKSNHWKAKRHESINDDSVCHQCGCKGILQLHHLSYKRLGNESIKDLIPLCDKCHKEAHKNKDIEKEKNKLKNIIKNKRKNKKSKQKRFCKNCKYHQKMRISGLGNKDYCNLTCEVVSPSYKCKKHKYKQGAKIMQMKL